MNRAWIPAGALAGVSVAGLIALGPLTGSLTSQPPFPTVVTLPVPQTPSKSAPVDYNLKSVGTIAHASYRGRGGQAAAAAQNGDTGPVSLQIKKPAPQTSHATAPPAPPTAPAKPVKKPVKRPASIGATSGPNGDAGLAGSNPNGPTHRGEQQSTPGEAP